MYLREIIYIGGWGFLAFCFSRVLRLNVGCEFKCSSCFISFCCGGGGGGGGQWVYTFLRIAAPAVQFHDLFDNISEAFAILSFMTAIMIQHII